MKLSTASIITLIIGGVLMLLSMIIKSDDMVTWSMCTIIVGLLMDIMNRLFWDGEW